VIKKLKPEPSQKVFGEKGMFCKEMERGDDNHSFLTIIIKTQQEGCPREKVRNTRGTIGTLGKDFDAQTTIGVTQLHHLGGEERSHEEMARGR